MSGRSTSGRRSDVVRTSLISGRRPENRLAGNGNAPRSDAGQQSERVAEAPCTRDGRARSFTDLQIRYVLGSVTRAGRTQVSCMEVPGVRAILWRPDQRGPISVSALLPCSKYNLFSQIFTKLCTFSSEFCYILGKFRK